MRKVLLAWAAAVGLTWCAGTANQDSYVNNQIHATIIGWDGVTPYASTFTEDASTPMQWEWEYANEVCWATLVSNLPVSIQNVIYDTWGEVEQVRECTSEEDPMHDY